MSDTTASQPSAARASAVRTPLLARVPAPVRGWVIPVALLVIWWLAFHLGDAQSAIFASPEQVLKTAVRLIANGELWHSLSASLYRLSIGFGIGVSAGLIFGAALGFSRLFEYTIGPTFHTFKQISLFAWIPILSAWFGLGDAGKIAFLAMAAFFPVVLNTFEGIRSVPSALLDVAKAGVFSRRQVLIHVVLPSATPSIFTGIYLALIYAWLATLGAEYLLSTGPGIGTLLVEGQEHFWMDQILLGVVIVGLIGFLLSWSTTYIESRLLRWRGKSTAQY